MKTKNKQNSMFVEKGLIDHFFQIVELWWVILVGLGIGLGFAYYKWAKIPDIYRAVAIIEVARKTNVGADLSRSRQSKYYYQLTARVADKLKLDSAYYDVADAPEFRGLLSSGFTRAKAAKILRSWTKVIYAPGSPLIELYCYHSDPVIAHKVLDVLLREYQGKVREKSVAETRMNKRILDEQISESKANLNKMDASLVIYRQALSLADAVSDVKSSLEELEEKYLPGWPKLKQEKIRLNDLIVDFESELQDVLDKSDEESEFWGKQISLINPAEQNLITFKIETVKNRNTNLRRDFEADSDLYATLLQTRKISDVESETTLSDIVVLEQPFIPKEPVASKKNNLFLKFGLIGFSSSLALALLIGRIDQRIKRIEGLEYISKKSVLTVIPKSKKLASGLLSKDSQSYEYETIRNLHTQILLAAPDAKVVLVTSSIPSEGKSTTSSNLAATIAEWGWGQKVLLIDLDLRKPRVHSYLGIDPSQPGVSDYLIANVDINSCLLRHDDVNNFFVMPAGTLRFNERLPSEEDLTVMLNLLKGSFDKIVIDSAPILAVSDSLVLAKYADAICLVFKMWGTSRSAIARTINLLEVNETPPVGVVANSMIKKKWLGQAAYYLSYGGEYQAYADESKS